MLPRASRPSHRISIEVRSPLTPTTSQMMHALAIEDGLDTIKCVIDAASLAFDISHFAVTGYCMGGTFALRAACEVEGIDAAAPFYGDIPDDEILQKLKTPTIFVSGTRDAWINSEKVAALEDAAERFELPIHSVKYDADHAFFNNTRPSFTTRSPQTTPGRSSSGSSTTSFKKDSE